MSVPPEGIREGSLEAPTRHPIDWKNPQFWDKDALFDELERIYDICHGCRRCVSLCNAFPTLFDLIDESDTMEVDGVAKDDYWKVIDHCYLCDMCYMSKCPYVPPHPWNVDFPHLMLRAKAYKFRQNGATLRDKLVSSTDLVGTLAGIPVVAGVVNAANTTRPLRAALDKVLGIHKDANLPRYHAKTLRRRVKGRQGLAPERAEPTDTTRGKVVLFGTCYGNYNEPHLGEDLIAVFEHNGIPMRTTPKEQCCGMPKLELGDFESVEKAKNANIPMLARLVDEGWDIVAPVPSCVLMFKQELPLMFPDDAEVQKVRNAFYDPFEYLALRHKSGKLDTNFKTALGKISYQVSCHLRVQNIGLKTRDVLQLIPDTHVDPIERCSGHDGTYAVKKEFYETSMKIARPVVNRINKAEPEHYSSDCPIAGHHLEHGRGDGSMVEHPLTLLRKAYGI